MLFSYFLGDLIDLPNLPVEILKKVPGVVIEKHLMSITYVGICFDVEFFSSLCHISYDAVLVTNEHTTPAVGGGHVLESRHDQRFCDILQGVDSGVGLIDNIA